MKKSLKKKLFINKQTLASLNADRLNQVFGGQDTETCIATCNTEAGNCSYVVGICGQMTIDIPCQTENGGGCMVTKWPYPCYTIALGRECN